MCIHEAEERDPSQMSSQSFVGGSPQWVRATGFEANKHLISCLLTLPLPCLWGRAWKRGARDPEARLPLSPLVPLLQPPRAAAATDTWPISPRAHIWGTKKLQESPNVSCGGLTCSSQGEIVIVVVFNCNIESVELFFYLCQHSHPWLKPSLGRCCALLCLCCIHCVLFIHLLLQLTAGRGVGVGLAAMRELYGAPGALHAEGWSAPGWHLWHVPIISFLLH